MMPTFGITASGKATQIIEFKWEQVNSVLPQISGWVLYGSVTSGSGYVKIKDIQYSPITPDRLQPKQHFQRK